jgi:hypothetical protein
MRQPVSITTPYPTPGRVARTYGISASRAKELKRIMEESIAGRVLFHKNGGGSSLSKNGAGRKATKAGSVARRKRKRGKAKNSD